MLGMKYRGGARGDKDPKNGKKRKISKVGKNSTRLDRDFVVPGVFDAAPQTHSPAFG